MDSSENPVGEKVLALSGVTKRYNLDGGRTVTALAGVNMGCPGGVDAITRGEFVIILGPSGGGKLRARFFFLLFFIFFFSFFFFSSFFFFFLFSHHGGPVLVASSRRTTLLNILGTLDKPSTGSVEIFGQTVDASSTDEYLAHLRLHRIGFVFQSYNLLATMSAFENVELPMTIAGQLSATQRRERALGLLALVGLRERAGHLPSELSGGEQQRVTIARALANSPDLVLCDEPTGSLDSKYSLHIMELLTAVNRRSGVTVAMVTHDTELACYADRVLYVEDGRFVKQVYNETPVRLVYEDYIDYLNIQDGGHAN
jgi:putative ABC transport system ATP-binding protein